MAALALGGSHLSGDAARIHGLMFFACVAWQVPDGFLVAVAHLVRIKVVSFVWLVETKTFDVESFVDCTERA